MMGRGETAAKSRKINSPVVNARYVAFLQTVERFRGFSETDFECIADSLETATFSKGETICKEGDGADCMYIVQHGSVKIFKHGKCVSEVETGSTFGEAALMERNRTRTVQPCTNNSPSHSTNRNDQPTLRPSPSNPNRICASITNPYATTNPSDDQPCT